MTYKPLIFTTHPRKTSSETHVSHFPTRLPLGPGVQARLPRWDLRVEGCGADGRHGPPAAQGHRGLRRPPLNPPL